MPHDDGSPLNHEPAIRPAAPADIDALVELAATTFHETHAPFLEPADVDDYVTGNFTRAAFEVILADAASTLRVCEGGGRLLGYLHLRRSTPPACVTGRAPIELVRIYLRREVIGRGQGARLMRTARAEAARRGCDALWLMVYERNERARTFYGKWGFVDVGTAPFRFGGREYSDPVMAAPLT